MKRPGLRRAGAFATAALCAGAIGATAVGASASSADRQDDTATITMELKGKKPYFAGARSVEAGTELAIINNTDPEAIGPHTFTLVDKSELPKTKAEIKECGKLKSDFCLGIVEDHKVDLKTGEVGKPSIDVGKEGWDASYGKKGDSWVAEAEGDEEDRVVSAKPGTKLYYFCLVHPEMQGKIKVK